MKKYHAITLERPNYVPMDPKEKAEKIRRLEARLAGKVSLDDNGNLASYGLIESKPIVIEDDPYSAIDDARLDLGRTRLAASSTPAPIMDDVNTFVDVPKPVMSQQEFEERVEKLFQQSEAFHKEFMAKFGPKE